MLLKKNKSGFMCRAVRYLQFILKILKHNEYIILIQKYSHSISRISYRLPTSGIIARRYLLICCALYEISLFYALYLLAIKALRGKQNISTLTTV